MTLQGNESNHVVQGLTVQGGLQVLGNLDVLGQSSQGGYQDSVDARSFGVTANGVTDDTTALQRALTATGAAGGGVVVLPVGTTLVSGVTVPASTWLRGQGLASIVKLKSASNADVVKLTGAFSRVSDLWVEGNSAGQSSGFPAGVRLAANDCLAERVTVNDAYKYGFYSVNVQRPVIQGCTVLNSLYIGIYVEAAGGVTDVASPVISGCRVDRSGIAAASIVEGGIKVHAATPKVVSRARISDCHVEMPASPTDDTAIPIETFGGVQRAVVCGNTTSGGSIGISCDTSPDSAVTGNTVTGAKLYGIEVVKSNNLAVSGNTVTGSALTVRGIAVNGTSSSSASVSITGNNVTDCTGYGIRSQGATQITISGNACLLTGSAGIYVQNATYSSVTGNLVTDVALTMNDGIFFDGCTWLTCTGNTISGVDNNGVLVYAASAITIRAFVFANAVDVVGVAQAVSTNLSGGAALSAQSQVWGNSDGASNQLNWLSNVRVLTGTLTPESVVTAGVGSLFLRTDGGVSTTLYVKTSGTGNTGWTAK